MKAYAASRGIDVDVPIHLTRPPDPGMGDYASNVAILLAEKEKRCPTDVAGDLAALLEDREGLLEEPPRPAGKGFLNFRVRFACWVVMVPQVRRQGKEFFLRREGRRDRINVEFVSANPTGPLHVGHGRGAIIGDALVRILRAAGHDVTAEYYVNDRGRQIRKLGTSLHYRYNKLFDPDFPPPEKDDWYQGDYVEDLAKELKEKRGSSLLGLSSGEGEFSKFAASRLEDRIREDLEDIGINFDCWFHESKISDEQIWEKINELKERGYAWEDDKNHSVAFRMGGEGESGDTKDRILVKSGKDGKEYGEFTYFATDIVYHLDKIARGFTRLINIWGADHHGYIPRMKASLKAFGYDPGMLQVILVQMVSLSRSGQPVRMSKRSGQFATLREIVAEVGRDALRFIFLTRRPESQFDFDIDLAKKRNLENPVFHVQYGHARLCSMLRRAEQQFGIDLNRVSETETQNLLERKLILEEERRILKQALKLGEEIADCARTLQPHRLATFAMEVSKALQSYYTIRWRVHRDPVLPPQALLAQGEDRWRWVWDMEKTLARLLWIDVVKKALGTALDLLGVEAPEKMEKAGSEEEEDECCPIESD